MAIRWKKTLGQHLLHDANIIRKFVSALNLSAGEKVIEVGPGSGALTEFLVKEPVNITAVELDKQFFEILNEKFSDQSNFELISGNILETALSGLISGNEKAVVTGNLPYNLTSQILFHVFKWREQVSRIVVTIQKEVAERITAPVRSKNRGILSVICQFHSDPKILFNVSRNCFFPKPKVDSAVLGLRIKPVPEIPDPEDFFKLVKTAFGKRRKTLRNSLNDFPGINLSEIEKNFDLGRRPEELEVEEFVSMAKIIFKQ